MQIRIGHHFASKLTDYGRGQGLKLQEIPFAEAQRIYEEQAQTKPPLTEKEFREVISAETMVFGRKGLGGPQKSHITSAIGKLSNDLAHQKSILTTSNFKTKCLLQKLHENFSQLIR